MPYLLVNTNKNVSRPIIDLLSGHINLRSLKTQWQNENKEGLEYIEHLLCPCRLMSKRRHCTLGEPMMSRLKAFLFLDFQRYLNYYSLSSIDLSQTTTTSFHHLSYIMLMFPIFNFSGCTYKCYREKHYGLWNDMCPLT